MKTKGIEKRTTKNGVSYRASAMIKGKVIRKTFKKESSAIKWKENISNEREKNKRLGVKTNNYISYNELFNLFINSKAEKRHTTLKVYESTHSNHLSPYIGNTTIRDLSLDDYDKIKSALVKKKCSKHLIKKVSDLFKSVLNFAVKRSYLDYNFLTRIETPKIDKTGYKFWKPSQISKFLKLIKSEYYYNVILFAFNTGLRRGEICGLKWSNIDFKDESITFGSQRLSDGSQGDVKAGKTRTIPLTKNAIVALKNEKKRSIFLNDSDFVFLNKKNKPINPDNLTTTFGNLQSKYQVKDRMTFHGTRHSFASYLASQNIPIQIIQGLLGHSDIAVTQRYVHLTLKDLRDTTSKVNL